MKYVHKIALGIDCFLSEARRLGGAAQVVDIYGTGRLVPGYAADQIRLCSEFSNDPSALQAMLVTLGSKAERLVQGKLMFSSARPLGQERKPQVAFWEAPEVRALTMPLHDPSEGNSHSTDLYQLGDSGTCVVDFDVTEQDDVGRLLRYNLLNAVAPVVLQYSHQHYNLPRVGRHRALRYVGRRERVPTGWEWQPNWNEYEKNVQSMTTMFAQTESRSRFRSVLNDGIFHFAQLLEVEQRKVVRFWAMPTMSPEQVCATIKHIEDWLVGSLQKVDGKNINSLLEAVSSLPDFQGHPLPTGYAPRLYLWEMY